MARISIDDNVESRPEYRKLLKLVGYDDDKALGMLIRFWRLAQEYWGQGKLIPLEEIENWEFQPIIESRWGIVKPEGVYAKGSETHFGWYRQRVEAGKQRGEAPRDEKGQFLKTPAEHQRNTSGSPARSSDSPAEHQPLTLTLSSSPIQKQEEESPSGICAHDAQQVSPGGLNQKKPLFSALPGGDPDPKQGLPEVLHPPPVGEGRPEPLFPRLSSVPSLPSGGTPPGEKRGKFSDFTRKKMQAFIAAYAEGYKAKYGGPPEGIKDKAVLGKLGHWIESVSQDHAVGLVQVYLQLSYRPFEESNHSLQQFFWHLNRIGNALNTGKDSDSIDWEKVWEIDAARRVQQTHGSAS